MVKVRIRQSVKNRSVKINLVVIPYLRLNTAANKLDSNEQLLFLSLQSQKDFNSLTCTMQSVQHQSSMTSQTPESRIPVSNA